MKFGVVRFPGSCDEHDAQAKTDGNISAPPTLPAVRLITPKLLATLPAMAVPLVVILPAMLRLPPTLPPLRVAVLLPLTEPLTAVPARLITPLAVVTEPERPAA